MGFRMINYGYHLYRLIWNDMNVKDILVDDIEMMFSCPTVDVISHKYNFAVGKLSHYQDYNQNGKYDPKKVFGNQVALGLHRDAFNKSIFNETVYINFELKQINSYI